jgi:hypothetical protein
MLDELRTVILRDLHAVAREVEAYGSDEALWRAVPGVTNTGGMLALHLAGNLRHFIGATLGATGYRRDRDAEFAQRGASHALPLMPRAEVSAEVRRAAEDVDMTLRALPHVRLEETFPVAVVGRRVGTAQFLVHLASHLGYHLGQLDYHRRITDPAAQGPAGAMSIEELPAAE